jgi:prepilin peptidase CpaA
VTLAIWLVLGACAIAVATDVVTRRIPNALTLALAAAALILHGLHGWAPLGVAVAAMAAVLCLGYVAFSFGWLGGGDVKLLAASAATLGFPDAIPFLLYTAIGGGVLGCAFAVATGRLGSVFRAVGLILRPFAYNGTVAIKPTSPTMMPYACAIALGAVAVALSHTSAPFLRLHL